MEDIRCNIVMKHLYVIQYESFIISSLDHWRIRSQYGMTCYDLNPKTFFVWVGNVEMLEIMFFLFETIGVAMKKTQGSKPSTQSMLLGKA